ncbi:MAG: DUF3320 domain-containing protein [Candidatus Polarisedimenticolia bacterium]
MADEDRLVVECEYQRTVNYALQKNHIPIITRLRVSNRCTDEVEQLTLHIQTTPAFAEPWTGYLATLAPGSSIDIGPVDMVLSPTFLAGLTERFEGSLALTIEANSAVLHSSTYPLGVLAYDQWNGFEAAPELIAAFVTPNHPEVSKVLRQAADILGSWTDSATLNGYQTRDPNRARLQMAAIYTAMQRLTIAYCVPPASFEQRGQRVRTPDVIRETRLATCLDLAVFYAACAEAAGLSPLLVFSEGHAFVGAWLIDETFPESIQDDPTLIAKRVAPGVRDICVVETTALTAEQTCPFDRACELAETELSDHSAFHCFVDIKRARASGIYPLPSRVAGVPVDAVCESSLNSVPGLVQRPGDVSCLPSADSRDDTAVGRLAQWERKLLDLSLRNPLLNFRPTGASLPLLIPELHELEDALADGDDFQVLPRPTELDATPRDSIVLRRHTNSDPQLALLRTEFAQHRLRGDLSDKELPTRLTALYRAARNGLEENGANTLYLALGLLLWYESDRTERPRYAPILLLPMEIVRRSVATGYVVRMAEDEPVLNVTMLAMLKHDFGIEVAGLDPLPKDDHGIDVQRVFAVVRRAVMHQSRWDVLPDAYLGLFTFSKFVMWNDLTTRSSDLRRSPLVASLIDGDLKGIPLTGFPPPEQLDQRHPAEIFCPLGADAHQLSAVVAAEAGHTFVLHGPPGTGKSHTITNIIAHALANRKTVLFVAEKMAALSVVHRNLCRIGLAPFCLEVHSNKSRKSTVLQQLGNALSMAHTASPESWQHDATRLAALRDELNAYVRALHRPRQIGISVFAGLARLSAVRDAPASFHLDPDTVAGMKPEDLQSWTTLVHQLRIAGQACGRVGDHPWALCHRQDYTPSLRGDIADALTTVQRSLAHLRAQQSQVAGLLHLPSNAATYDQTRATADLAESILDAPSFPGALIRIADWTATQHTVDSWVAHGRARDALRATLRPRYREPARFLDVGRLQALLQTAEHRWFFSRWLVHRCVAKVLRATMTPGASLSHSDLRHDLVEIARWVQEENALSAALSQASELLGQVWANGDPPDWNAVAATTQWAARVRHTVDRALAGELTGIVAVRERLAHLMTERPEELLAAGAIGKHLALFRDRVAEFQTAWTDATRLLAVTPEVPPLGSPLGGWAETLAALVERWLQSLDKLRDWCTWVTASVAAEAAGLGAVVQECTTGHLENDQIEPAFQRALYNTWAEREVASDPALAGFSRSLFEDKITQFRALDRQFSDLTKREVVARLSSRVPDGRRDTAAASELGILKNQLQRQRGHMALRELFRRIPNLLPRLTPCLLMSPMSVAQYLDPSHPQFDLVIFDEASQVPTWDAVGAIARGRQAIIVGDPNQLPPTSVSFFARAIDDDTVDGATLQDLDSILKDCITLSVPEAHLRWHYRSRHESLIAFSNVQYYGSRLETFPSPDDQTSAVRWRLVNGTYDRGGSKQNRVEADAVVSELLRRLTDPVLSQQSVGIVTFNLAQQQLIEDMVDERIRVSPELEDLFSKGPDLEAKPEPVFVKNLENVQGDERDVILISVGYGADAQGRVAMNFGPLNQDGGWRRLNVIVSRARSEMVVFSSIRADQLDLSRTRSRGVADLRAFLDYAERGKRALAEQVTSVPDNLCESIFEEQVCVALRKRGHTVHAQVGCSGYRIDLAIVDPQRPGTYLLGIECDGATYHRAKTARDRDKLRQDILCTELGWRLYRVWSTDWWENPERELDRIEAAILSAAQDRSRPGTPPHPQSAPSKPIASLIAALAPARVASPPTRGRPYVACCLPSTRRDAEHFYVPESDRTLVEQILKVVGLEEPISLDLLCRRIIAAWGMGRVGGRIEERIRRVCGVAGLRHTTTGHVDFFWMPTTTVEAYDMFRTPGSADETRRRPEDLPAEEIANAAAELLENQVSMPEADLVRELARVFGFHRTGACVTQVLKEGLKYLVHKGMATETDGRLVHR